MRLVGGGARVSRRSYGVVGGSRTRGALGNLQWSSVFSEYQRNIIQPPTGKDLTCLALHTPDVLFSTTPLCQGGVLLSIKCNVRFNVGTKMIHLCFKEKKKTF